MAALSAVLAGNAGALPLGITDGFSTAGQGLEPEGLAFVADSDGAGPLVDMLVASDGASFFGNLYRYDLAGNLLGTISAPLGRIRGIDVRADTGTVLYSTGGNRLIAEYDSDFVTPTVGGINFLVPAVDLGTGIDVDVEAVVYHPDTGTLFIADDGRGLILEFDVNGNMLDFVITANLALAQGVAVLDGPSGMTVDPFTGNLIITDDSSAANGRVFEITTDFLVVDATDNLLLTALVGVCNAVNGPGIGCIDGEAVAVDAATRTFFFAFEEEMVITTAIPAPEPGSLALLALAVGVGLSTRRRRA